MAPAAFAIKLKFHTKTSLVLKDRERWKKTEKKLQPGSFVEIVTVSLDLNCDFVNVLTLFLFFPFEKLPKIHLFFT